MGTPCYRFRFALAGAAAVLLTASAAPVSLAAPAAGGSPADPAAYNVVWDSPSAGPSGSMPLGNGDIGLNAWVEPGGDLVFYISKTDAWDAHHRLLKLGRVRVRLSPAPVAAGAPFRQTLHLGRGEMEVVAGPADRGATLRVWVDAVRPVVRVEADSRRPVEFLAALEVWRTEARPLTGPEAHGVDPIEPGQPPSVEPDVVLPAAGDRVTWYHRNARSLWPVTLRHQGLESLIPRLTDPLLGRTFGGLMRGPGLVSRDAATLVSVKPSTRHALAIHVLTARTESAEAWRRQVEGLAAATDAVGLEDARAAHLAWWRQFWGRSWIRATGPALAGGLTSNSLPLRIGADSDGANRFLGRMARARVWREALGAAEVAALARQDRSAALPASAALVADWRLGETRDGLCRNLAADALHARVVGEVSAVEDGGGRVLAFGGQGYLEVGADARLDLADGFTLEAWARPDRLPGGGARILDKSKAGTSNGYLLDTYPGNSLRTIVDAGTLRHDARLEPGRWVHVAAVFDASQGWQRLYVDGREAASQRAGGALTPEIVSRGYALQRFINACGGRGASPIKFNGSLFTVDARVDGRDLDADYRRWGGGYWFQNTRLPYWAMLAAGDVDLLPPLFAMYRDALPLAEARTRLYYGHDGAFFPETMYFWGTYENGGMGYGRPFGEKPPGLTDNRYIRYYWSGGLELAALMLEAHALTGDAALLRETLLPLARSVATFFDRHWPRGPDGRIRFEPAQSLETWWDCVNPLPEIAGLRLVLGRLLALADPAVTAADRAAWQRTLDALPPVPMKTEGGRRFLLPAETFGKASNSENPELYAVFPYPLYGVGRPDLEVALETWARRLVKRTGGWTQDAIQAACLGLAEEAAVATARNFAASDPGSRFPAFWGPNFDWTPDQDHGGVSMIALQRMLLQWDGRRLFVLPAWPPAWDVAFRLHAPYATTVEGVYRAGRLERLLVTPAARQGDVVGPSPP